MVDFEETATQTKLKAVVSLDSCSWSLFGESWLTLTSDPSSKSGSRVYVLERPSSVS
jgi:hypothetical protein